VGATHGSPSGKNTVASNLDENFLLPSGGRSAVFLWEERYYWTTKTTKMYWCLEYANKLASRDTPLLFICLTKGWDVLRPVPTPPTLFAITNITKRKRELFFLNRKVFFA
jgi:hypothetical protein